VNYTFRILSIDLGNQDTDLMHIPGEDLRAYLGGASLGARLLYPWMEKDLDPLSPEAPLLFITGPLTGTAGPAVGRYVLCAKSPATRLWGESNIGGYFGPEMRAAGYDGLLITGRAPEPVYLWIHDRQVEVRSAVHLWGSCDTYETQTRIKEEFGDRQVRVACIGLAGENQLQFASVLCDHGRAAGRTGMGAVMGSKRLKAVAVRGTEPPLIIHQEAFSVSRSASNKALRNDNFSRILRETGTAGALDYWEYLGEMPIRYFTAGVFPQAEKLSGATVSETVLSRISACHACVIACGRVVQLQDGQARKGLEYETTAGLGSNLWIDDLPAVTMLSELCDRYGIDTISLSNTIGLAFLLYQEGILTDKDTGGERLEWGDAEVVERLIHQTVRREGLGALLARGARSLAIHYGVPGMAAQVNGLEIPYHDPRASSGMALVYATSPRGACHNQSDYFMVDTSGQTVESVGVDFYERHAGAEKVANIANHQNWRTLSNSLVICFFSNVSPETVLDLINQVTGFDYTLEELARIGERSWTLKRVINHRLGLKGENDRLPTHLLKPLPDGGAAGYVPPMEEMLAAYYQARGWDPVTGRPTPMLMQTLDLDDLITDIWNEEELSGL
jgi:aldehyde:ferredoxin oxidoreductase